MNDRDKINYAKSELRNYNFLKRALEGALNRYNEIESKIHNYKPSPILISNDMGNSGNSPNDPRKAELYDDLDRAQGNVDAIMLRVVKIDQFLQGLTSGYREIFERVYILYDEDIGFSFFAEKHHCSVRTMKRRIDGLILKNFEI